MKIFILYIFLFFNLNSAENSSDLESKEKDFINFLAGIKLDLGTPPTKRKPAYDITCIDDKCLLTAKRIGEKNITPLTVEPEPEPNINNDSRNILTDFVIGSEGLIKAVEKNIVR